MTCRCVICHQCKGTGHCRVEDRYQPEGWDLENCPYCNGYGIERDGMCEECYMFERDEMERLEAIP